MSKFEFRQGKETVSSLTEALRKEVSTGVGKEALVSTIEVNYKKYTPVELRELRNDFEELVQDRKTGGRDFDTIFDEIKNDTESEDLNDGWKRLVGLVETGANPMSGSADRKKTLERRDTLVGLIASLEDANKNSLNTYKNTYWGNGREERRSVGFDESTGRIYIDSRKKAYRASFKREWINAAKKLVIYKTETGMWPGGNPYPKDSEAFREEF